MDTTFKHEVLGKYCMIFLKSTEQAAMYKGTSLKMAMFVEGLVVKITDDYLYMSEGDSDKVEKIIPINSIGYIDVDPELDDKSIAGFLEEGKGDDEDDGRRH